MECRRCGAPAAYISPFSGVPLCDRCVAAVVLRRFRRELCRASPRRDERFYLLATGDRTETLVALDLLIRVERGFPSRVTMVGTRLLDPLRAAALLGEGMAVVPYSLESYLADRLARLASGDLAFPALEGQARVVYPLSSTPRAEVEAYARVRGLPVTRARYPRIVTMLLKGSPTSLFAAKRFFGNISRIPAKPGI